MEVKNIRVLVRLYWERSTVLVHLKRPVRQAIRTPIAQPPRRLQNRFQYSHASIAKLAHVGISAGGVRALVSL